MFSEAYMHGLAHHLMTVSTSDGVGLEMQLSVFTNTSYFPILSEYSPDTDTTSR